MWISIYVSVSMSSWRVDSVLLGVSVTLDENLHLPLFEFKSPHLSSPCGAECYVFSLNCKLTKKLWVFYMVVVEFLLQH